MTAEPDGPDHWTVPPLYTFDVAGCAADPSGRGTWVEVAHEFSR